METTVHDGRRTAYEIADEGDEPGVVYVHGSGATSELWRAQLEHGPGRGVALDLSGHGESDDIDTDPGTETLAAYAEDVRAVFEATESRVLVGNSLGGAVCLRAVLDGSVSPAGLVLAGSGAKLTVTNDLLEWLDDDFERAVEFLHEPGLLFESAGEKARERSKATMYDVGRRVTSRDFRSCHTFDVRSRLGEIHSPVLAVCGEHDGLTPPAYHEYLAENVQNGDSEELADAAHLAMVERPRAFDDALVRFLDRLE